MLNYLSGEVIGYLKEASPNRFRNHFKHFPDAEPEAVPIALYLIHQPNDRKHLSGWLQSALILHICKSVIVIQSNSIMDVPSSSGYLPLDEYAPHVFDLSRKVNYSLCESSSLHTRLLTYS